MTREHDFIGLLEDYLDDLEGSTPLPDAIRDAIRAQLPSTLQRRAWWPARRDAAMNRILGVGLAAAAVALVAVVAIQDFGRTDVGISAGDEPPSPATSAAASCSIVNPNEEPDAVPCGMLEPGTYTAYEIDGRIVNARFTVPAGWSWNGTYLSKGGMDSPAGAAIFFFGGRNVQVYSHPCQWAGAASDSPTGSSVNDLVAALAAQPMRNATTPTDRNAAVPNPPGTHEPELEGRWAGMSVELTVPDYIDFGDCDRGEFRSWGPDDNARSHQGPGQRDLVWVVDTRGNGVAAEGALAERLIIDAATFPGTPADVMAEIEAILDSMEIGHWG